MKISIISAVYDEKELAAQTIKRAIELTGNHLHEVIIIIAPAASEETWEACNSLAQKHPFTRVVKQEQNPGVGLAYRQGFELAKGDQILVLDSDGEYDPEVIPLMIKKMEETDARVVIASRWIKDGGFEGYDPIKYWFNYLFQKMFRILFLTSVHDLTLGYKLMDAEVVKSIKWGGKGHELNTETTLKPLRCGYKIAEVPHIWRGRQTGTSVNSLWKTFKWYVPMAVKIRFSPKSSFKK